MSGGTYEHGIESIHLYIDGLDVQQTWPFVLDFRKDFMISHYLLVIIIF